MKEHNDLTPSAGEIISDIIVALQRALEADSGPISRTLAELILSDLAIARDHIARHTSRGFLRRKQS
jgi:hypothetical protein